MKRNIKGGGDSIYQKLHLISKGGTCPLYEKIKVNGDDPREELMKVYGIGNKKATEIVESGITTIEGLSNNGKMHPMQEAFKKHHGLQCGFCTPGMVMSAVDLLQKNKNPNEQQIRDWLEGNICRCTGYQNIVAAVKEAASKM